MAKVRRTAGQWLDIGVVVALQVTSSVRFGLERGGAGIPGNIEHYWH